MARILILMAVLLVVVGHPALGQAPPEILGTPRGLAKAGALMTRGHL